MDNLPIQLIMRFAQIAYGNDNDINNVAIGVDSRFSINILSNSAFNSLVKRLVVSMI